MRPGRGCRYLSMVCALVAATQAAAQSQWARFDGSAQTSPGLRFNFGRPVPVYGAEGQLVGVDQPRWAQPTLFCGVAESETIKTGISTLPIASGYATDGTTPVFIIRNATQTQLTIHVGEGSVEQGYQAGDWNGIYRLRYRDQTKQDHANLLVGQTGVNGGTADRPDIAFSPSGAGCVFNGLIVLNCEVLQLEAPYFHSRRIALAYTTVERLSQPDPWIIAAVSEPTINADNSRGSAWSFSPFVTGPNSLTAVWTDYRMPAKSGGTCYATRFSRVGGQWSSESIRIARNDNALTGQHWHCGGLIRHPDGRQTVVVSIGDAIEENQLLATTIGPGEPWSAGFAVDGSGIDARSVVYERSDSWTPTAVVWGGQGFEPALRHNQCIVMRAADAAGSALVCGCDETDASLLRLEYDPDAQRPTWTTLFMPTVTSWPSDGVTDFTLHGVPGGPYLARIDAAGASDWDAQERETRVLFSPDGWRWGQCAVAYTSTQRPAIFVDDTIYLGSAATESVGLRRLAMPTWRDVRPLAVGASGANLLRAQIPLPSSNVDPGVTIQRLSVPADLPAGVPPPPCAPTNVFLIDNESTEGRLGTWRPVSDLLNVDPPKSSVLVRAWLYALGPQSPGDPATTAQLAARIANSNSVYLNEWVGRSDFDSGAWAPLNIWLPAYDFPAGESWLPVVELRAELKAFVNTRFRFLIAWEGFYQDAPTVRSVGLPPEQPATEETAVLDGLDLPGDWTTFAVGMVPWDQWDNRVGGSSTGGFKTRSTYRLNLFSIQNEDASASVEVKANPVIQETQFFYNQTDGGGNGAVDPNSTFWLRGSPVMCMVRSTGGKLTLDYSVGGAMPRRLAVNGGLTPSRVRLGPEPMLWRSFEAIPKALPDADVLRAFTSMSLRCPADFDENDTVNTGDVIAFLNAWVTMDPRADTNHDGAINTADVIAFLNAFAAKC
ncbi:MAG: hypothetical protein IPJ41_18180 [Phycisphaerales bacterium]|nr:hypothetical protein [Phycisphaerales bacterium]